jgi:hypothetical protein
MMSWPTVEQELVGWVSEIDCFNIGEHDHVGKARLLEMVSKDLNGDDRLDIAIRLKVYTRRLDEQVKAACAMALETSDFSPLNSLLSEKTFELHFMHDGTRFQSDGRREMAFNKFMTGK